MCRFVWSGRDARRDICEVCRGSGKRGCPTLAAPKKKKREKKVNKSYATQYSRRRTQPLATELLTAMLQAVRVMPFEEESARGLAEERLSSCFYVRTLRMWYPFSRVSLFHRRRVVIVCFWL